MKSAHSARPPVWLSHQGPETIDEGRQQPAINPRGEWKGKNSFNGKIKLH